MMIDVKLQSYFDDENEYADLNIEAYKAFFEDIDIRKLFKPLAFFQAVEKEFNFFNENANRYLGIKNHFDKLKGNGDNYYLLKHLTTLVNAKYAPYKSIFGSQTHTVYHDDLTLKACEYLNELCNEMQPKTAVNNDARLISISENYPLTYYTDKANIANQDLVNDTINYFETGPGARVFKPLTFLNLLEKQHRFVVDNLDNEVLVMAELKGLPLSELELHILYGLILKWFGGYPIIHSSDFNETCRKTKKVIEKEFLNYPENTPEKEFCKANKEGRNKMDMMGIALTDYANHGADPMQSLNAMGYFKGLQKTYQDFNSLFKDAFNDGLIKNLTDKEQFHVSQNKHHFEFKLWLEKQKGWIDRDENQFLTYLTQENFAEFLNFNNQDNRYDISNFFTEQLKATSKYKSLVEKIESRGFFPAIYNDKSIRIYTAELVLILTSKELPVYHIERQQQSTINTFDYFKSYANGYFDGEKYFDKEFLISADTLYGPNAKQYIKDIHLNYFHLKNAGSNHGWQYVKHEYPIILTHKYIKQIGYFSGIVSRVETMVEKYPDLFHTFYQNEVNSESQKLKVTPPLTIEQIALIYVYNEIPISRKNCNEIVEMHGHNSGEKLFQKYTSFSSHSKRIAKPNPSTLRKLKNKISLFEAIIENVNEKAKSRVLDEINILKAFISDFE